MKTDGIHFDRVSNTHLRVRERDGAEEGTKIGARCRAESGRALCCPRMKPASSRATNNGMKETWHAYGIPVRITIVITIIGGYGGGEKFAINR